MSMIEIMDSFHMNATGNESAVGTGNALVARQVHRQYPLDVKRRIVEETFAPGASVSVVARRHDVNANLVFDWRKKYRQGLLVDRQAGERSALSASAPATGAGHGLPPAKAGDLLRIGVVDHDGGIRALPAENGSPVPPPPTSRKETWLRESACPAPDGRIEIELPNGTKVRVDAGIDEASLRRVLAVTGAMA